MLRQLVGNAQADVTQRKSGGHSQCATRNSKSARHTKMSRLACVDVGPPGNDAGDKSTIRAGRSSAILSEMVAQLNLIS